jgi:hypothetical protein
MAQHFRLFGQSQKGFGTTRHVFRIQNRRCVPLQGTTTPAQEAHGINISYNYKFVDVFEKINKLFDLNRA